MDLNGIAQPLFLVYIGVALATFAFFCNSLSFAKSLLQDLSNICNEKPPRILDNRFFNGGTTHRNERANEIRCFFHESDVLTYTLLLYIVYSSLSVLFLLGCKLGVITGGHTKLVILFLTIAHTVVLTILAILKFKDTRENRIFSSRDKLLVFVVVYALISLFGVITILYVWPNNGTEGILLFLALIAGHICLYVAYLLSAVIRTPVSNLVDVWISLANDHNQPVADGSQVPPEQAQA